MSTSVRTDHTVSAGHGPKAHAGNTHVHRSRPRAPKQNPNKNHPHPPHHAPAPLYHPQGMVPEFYTLPPGAFRIPVLRLDNMPSREVRLQRFDIKDLHAAAHPQGVVKLEPNMSVDKAMKVLAANNILSAPVVDLTGKVVGILDAMDIAAHMLDAFLLDPTAPTAPPAWCTDTDTIQHRAIRYGLRPVHAIMGKSQANPMCTVYPSGDLFQLAEVLARGVHRVPVLSPDDQLIGVVSQSALLRFMDSHHDILADLALKSLNDLRLAKGGTLVAVHARQAAVQAFYEICCQRVSAVAVIDGSNRLVGNISASDLRGLGLQDICKLLLPCEDFLKVCRENGKLRPTVTALGTDSFGQCVSTLVDHRLHRLWVVDGMGCPVGVLSLTDVMQAVVNTGGSAGSA